MASGLPDYLKVVRQTYGRGLLKTGTKLAQPSGEKVLALIIGKGMIYGGVLWLDYTSSQANSNVKILLDESDLNDISFLGLNEYGITNPRSSVVTINHYDAVNYVYCVGISFGLTFESYLMLLYNNAYANQPTIHYRIVYTLF